MTNSSVTSPERRPLTLKKRFAVKKSGSCRIFYFTYDIR
jgi:hypothetical protein